MATVKKFLKNDEKKKRALLKTPAWEANVFSVIINACSQAGAIRAIQGGVGVCLVYMTNAGAPLMLSGSHQHSLCNAQPAIP